MNSRVLLGVTFGTTLLFASAFSAGATQIVPAPNFHGDTTTTSFGGTVNGTASAAGPWTAEIYANANEGLQLDVSLEFVDLEMVVAAPDGSVYRNDDRSPSDLKPL